MTEIVNPSHPDKIADRIAGALVDLAYKKNAGARMAAEVLIGHGKCFILTETTEHITEKEVSDIVLRIAKEKLDITYIENKQDPILSGNQAGHIRCGDNGIFKGRPLTREQKELFKIAADIYSHYPYDGKYILDGKRLIICQSNAKTDELRRIYPAAEVNPLGDWKGGLNVDSGATNRKLGSDMADSVSGGGLHGKDLSKADVTLNICAFLEAQRTGKPVDISCAIGDEYINGTPYSDYVKKAKNYIEALGGFEKFAEWGFFSWEE